MTSLFFLGWAAVTTGAVEHSAAVVFSGSSEEIPIYGDSSQLLMSLPVLGLALAAGLAFTLLAWERRPPETRLQAVYWIFLLLVMPMSLVNYSQNEAFYSHKQQAGLDLALIFLTIVCASALQKMSAPTFSQRTLKGMATLFMLLGGALVPTTFFILWLLNQLNMFTVEQLKASDGWVAALAAVGSLIVAVAAYLWPRAAPVNAKSTGELPPKTSHLYLPPDLERR